MSGDGAFSSRRRTGEGLLPFESRVLRPGLPLLCGLPLLGRSARLGVTRLNFKTRQGARLRGRRLEKELRHRSREENQGVSECRSPHWRTFEPVVHLRRAQCGMRLRKRITHGMPNQASNPSPVPLRLVKAPERDTLSPRERVDHSLPGSRLFVSF